MIIASDDKRLWGDSGELRCVTDVFGGGGGGVLLCDGAWVWMIGACRIYIQEWNETEGFKARLTADLREEAAAVDGGDAYMYGRMGQIIVCPVTVSRST